MFPARIQEGPRTGPGNVAFRTNALVPIVIALGSLLAGAIYTWFVGEDVNWDLAELPRV